MTQEEKELLLKYISAQVIYGLKLDCQVHGIWTAKGIYGERVLTDCEDEGKFNDFPVDIVKPYLRPMSSMTEEESEEYNDLTNLMSDYDSTIENIAIKIIDWLKAHHFDYLGLIPMGLALEAKEGMY